MPVAEVKPEDIVDRIEAARPYYELGEGGGATVYLSQAFHGKDVIEMAPLKARHFMEARAGAKDDQEQLYARLAAASSGISLANLGDLYLPDYLKLREVVDILGGF